MALSNDNQIPTLVVVNAMLWRSFSSAQCCLCGQSTEKLTGEHKVKASALRALFGSDQLMVGTTGTPGRMRAAQSANSKHLKFDASLCDGCNSSRTQEPDREFGRLSDLASAAIGRGEDPGAVFGLPQYTEGTVAFLNVFRYFAKLLCCQVAAVKGPAPVELARFAIGESPRNRIWLELKRDPVYSEFAPQLGEHGYAAHGGLVIYADKSSHTPNAFHSTLTIGALQYVFHMRLTGAERTELLATQASFCDWCRGKVGEGLANPVPEQTWERLGLAVSGAVDEGESKD